MPPRVRVKVKAKIPKALREQVWITYCGTKQFKRKCWIPWCKNEMNPFDFHVGHNIPESKGGKTTLDNLRPICARCNLSMSDDYSISEWIVFAGPPRCFFGLFVIPWAKPVKYEDIKAVKDTSTPTPTIKPKESSNSK